eukprot:scaffold286495_cov28-Attheya_sp.AAC.1
MPMCVPCWRWAREWGWMTHTFNSWQIPFTLEQPSRTRARQVPHAICHGTHGLRTDQIVLHAVLVQHVTPERIASLKNSSNSSASASDAIILTSNASEFFAADWDLMVLPVGSPALRSPLMTDVTGRGEAVAAVDDAAACVISLAMIAAEDDAETMSIGSQKEEENKFEGGGVLTISEAGDNR